MVLTCSFFIYLSVDSHLGCLDYLAIYYRGLQTKGPAPVFMKTVLLESNYAHPFTLPMAALRPQGQKGVVVMETDHMAHKA